MRIEMNDKVMTLGMRVMLANFGALINTDHELLRLHLTAMV